MNNQKSLFPHFSLILYYFLSSFVHDFLRLQNMTLTFACFITQTRTLLQLAAGENNKQEKKQQQPTIHMKKTNKKVYIP
jgi:hypothetical protein